MNYKQIYTAFIEKYKNQIFDDGVYTEIHHIVPRHAGGDDSQENLIRLNYRQHIFAHKLLWKIYKRAGDYLAWILMSKQESDKKLATLKAIGRANVESGHLTKIRDKANTPARKAKLTELNKHKVKSGLIFIYQKLANDAWRGCSHTEEWKENKSKEMKILMENPEHYSRMIEMQKLAIIKKKQYSQETSENLILNAERNEEFLHKNSSRSKNKFISPEGLEFDSPIFAAKYYGNIDYYIIENWCKRKQHGWSRKPKAEGV